MPLYRRHQPLEAVAIVADKDFVLDDLEGPRMSGKAGWVLAAIEMEPWVFRSMDEFLAAYGLVEKGVHTEHVRKIEDKLRRAIETGKWDVYSWPEEMTL